MAVKLKFDSTNNVECPTFALANRKGVKIGSIPAYNITFRDGLNTPSEISFRVNKTDNGVAYPFWDELKDFKLIYCREWNIWFEIYVELDESNDTVKNVIGKSLGEAELSQINLYDIEINTENDIEREDYKPTVFYNADYPAQSLLHKVLEKAAHYKIEHVDFSIAPIQRAFSFDNISIYDALQSISKEINCLFVVNSGSNAEGKIERSISVYDLESYCIDCGHREEFTDVCPECGGHNITNGYGEYTTIFVCADNLADNIKFTTDTGSVKNCFKLVAGDDLMTDTIANLNPNGSGYIWYIPKETRADMSDELVTRLDEYDTNYKYYLNEHITDLAGNKLTKYNDLITKYHAKNSELKTIARKITGYPDLMKADYQAMDFLYYLENIIFPNIDTLTTAGLQAANLNYHSLSPVAVSKLDNLNIDSANSAVLAMAKTIVNPDYAVEIYDSLFADNRWTGNFKVTHTKDETDTAIGSTFSVEFTENLEKQIEQKIDKTLVNSKKQIPGIITLFNYESDIFCDELKKYNLNALNVIDDACQSCIDMLIEEGIANKKNWANQSPDLYRIIYIPFYNKSKYIKNEIKLRNSEIKIITDLQSLINSHKTKIQEALNFEKFLGDDFWLDFIAYRRENTYKNNNYKSDGLTNTELFEYANEFIEVAKKDIYKSATLQHCITATLKNLLVMKEFQPIVNYFEVGNWIQVEIDDVVYRLRLLDYEIDFDDLKNLAITFSDVKKANNSVTDVESILNSAASMATSYGALVKQAGQGKKSSEQLNDWVNKGLTLTKMKIFDSAENQNITWDNHGLLCKEYLPITDTYDKKQLKIINRGLYLTDDEWQTSKAGIGDFTFYNPKSRQMEEAYGVIADTLVGNLILSENVGIYNVSNSVELDERGLTITANGVDNQTVFEIDKLEEDENGNENLKKLLFVDSDGNLVLNGSIRVNSAADTSVSTLDDIVNTERLTDTVNEIVHNETQTFYSTIDKKIAEQKEYADNILNAYKADIGQYMTYDENGLTLGAETSDFKTVIDNQGMYFKQGDVTVSYVNNNQLHIPNAVVESTLILGKFFFSPRADGGVSLTWQDD